MISDNILKNKEVENDPNIKQSEASNPLNSVWVGASAGTGKTKVLTDRVLRLMLPRENMGIETATAPHKILCLTFTKTAAAEMSARIYKSLSEWSIKSDADLRKELNKLMGAEVNDVTMSEARKLFAKVLDTPGGLKIMTIHSFCQSVLKRFPIEAGLSPRFELVDEAEAIEYLSKCLNDIIRESKFNPESKISKAFDNLTLQLDAEAMSALMKEVMSKRVNLHEIIATHGDDLINNLYQQLGVEYGVSEQDLISSARGDKLKYLIEPLMSGSVGDIKKAPIIQRWIEKGDNFTEYKAVFITQEGEIRKTLATKKILEQNEGAADMLYQEAEKILELSNKLVALKQANINEDFLILAAEMLGRYEEYKNRHDRLDYEDLIIRTSKLLSDKSMTQWVLYKLDSGIDHILVDEAQDTSPNQWKIVKALSEEFFEEFGSRQDIIRTLFVVGDDKQSIYSFQGADADEFHRMQKFFDNKVNLIDMNYSFRSTAAVLGSVDKIFNTEHLVFRKGQAGLVELWDLVEADDNDTGDNDEDDESAVEAWQLPTGIISNNSAKEKMAEKIASKIKTWLDNGEILKSKNRPIKASDIMILVQSRGEFVELLMRALKSADVPVAGFDRLKLTDEIAITDILALAKFALLPKDDLNLASLLKSPLINISEDELYDLCYNRKNYLWREVREKRPDIKEYLQQWIEKAGRFTPYEFFINILLTPCVASEISGRQAFLSRLGYEIEDAFDEFLNLCLHYEQSHIPSLQNFVGWFEKNPAEIKREQENGAMDLVRIMTVHAAKGLQAPIVMLPDCSRKWNDNNKARVTLIWPENSDNKKQLPLWSPRKDFESEIFTNKSSKEAEKKDAEYMRLLYVAMTRAEDRLYIGGWQGGRKIKEDCWYNLIKEKFPANALRLEDALHYELEQEVEVEAISKADTESRALITPEAWMLVSAANEPLPPKPLSPSKLDDEDMLAKDSPLSIKDDWKFSRGNIVHKILELVPELEKNNREAVIEKYLARECFAIPQQAQQELGQEIMAVLEHQDFAPIFSENSKAEVNITGVLSEKVISGTIDRLVVTENEVLIIDYKSNRNSPDDVADIPVVYLKQLAAYISLIRKIYPNKQVKSALLWTEKPLLMPVPNNILDPYLI